MSVRTGRLRGALAAMASLALLVSHGAAANSRALLIGVGTYELPNNDLPGIDLDIDNMRRVAQTLGFAPEEIQVLSDDRATYAGVNSALAGWLRNGVGPSDRVLVYFSGHGTRVPDPRPDNPAAIDDALVLHDARLARIAGRASLKNVLLGREFGQALALIPSRNVLVLIDACHSGTATRSLRLGNLSLGVDSGSIKHLSYPGEPASLPTRALRVNADPQNYAALSAARDNEFAVATSRGGLFTLGVVDAIQSAARQGLRPSVDDLRGTVSTYIESHTDEQSRHHPVTDGNPQLIRGALSVVPVREGHGPTWRALESLSTQGDTLQVSTPARQRAVGEEISLDVQVPHGGFLNIVAVDAEDQGTVLYPNRYSPANEVSAGAFHFPTPEMDFLLRAAAPLGPTLVVALLTEHRVNLLELGVEGRDAAGKLQQAFTGVGATATRAIAVEARHRSLTAGALTLDVTAAATAGAAAVPTAYPASAGGHAP